MSAFDCCMAFNERDMLELRLRTLYDAVDRFVIVEAGMTHSGQPKPAWIGDALQTERFAPFAEKIIYSYSATLSGANSWERERAHRGLIGGVLQVYARPDDLVIVGDVDEIPNPDVLSQIGDGAAMGMDFYYYDLQHRVRMGWGIGALRWRDEQDANAIRTLAGHTVPRIENGGWHFSYFATPEQVAVKLDAFMHHADPGIRDVPRDPEWLGAKMRAGKDLFGRDLQIDRVPLSDFLPRPLLEYRAQYEALGWLEAETVKER